MCMLLLKKKIDKITAFLTYRVASLCNQFLPEFSSNKVETCYKQTEAVHVKIKIVFN